MDYHCCAPCGVLVRPGDFALSICKGVAMNRKLRLSINLLVSAILVFAGSLPAPAATPAATDKDRLITVLNPGITTHLADRVPLAPRLKTLNGKTIYLVDTNWEGMEHNTSVLEEMQAWFAKHMPKVKTIIKIKRGSYMTDDAALWKEIADNKGDGVIIGVAG